MDYPVDDGFLFSTSDVLLTPPKFPGPPPPFNCERTVSDLLTNSPAKTGQQCMQEDPFFWEQFTSDDGFLLDEYVLKPFSNDHDKIRRLANNSGGDYSATDNDQQQLNDVNNYSTTLLVLLLGLAVFIGFLIVLTTVFAWRRCRKCRSNTSSIGGGSRRRRWWMVGRSEAVAAVAAQRRNLSNNNGSLVNTTASTITNDLGGTTSSQSIAAALYNNRNNVEQAYSGLDGYCQQQHPPTGGMWPFTNNTGCRYHQQTGGPTGIDDAGSSIPMINVPKTVIGLFPTLQQQQQQPLNRGHLDHNPYCYHSASSSHCPNHHHHQHHPQNGPPPATNATYGIGAAAMTDSTTASSCSSASPNVLDQNNNIVQPQQCSSCCTPYPLDQNAIVMALQQQQLQQEPIYEEIASSYYGMLMMNGIRNGISPAQFAAACQQQQQLHYPTLHYQQQQQQHAPCFATMQNYHNAVGYYPAQGQNLGGNFHPTSTTAPPLNSSSVPQQHINASASPQKHLSSQIGARPLTNLGTSSPSSTSASSASASPPSDSSSTYCYNDNTGSSVVGNGGGGICGANAAAKLLPPMANSFTSHAVDHGKKRGVVKGRNLSARRV